MHGCLLLCFHLDVQFASNAFPDVMPFLTGIILSFSAIAKWIEIQNVSNCLNFSSLIAAETVHSTSARFKAGIGSFLISYYGVQAQV